MKIGIDARLINETGVGRYIKNLIESLSSIDSENEYIVYLSPNAYRTFVLPNARWQKKELTVHWHSIAEQILLPFTYLTDKLDILHVPYFTVPIFYPGKIVVTVHDLIILTHPTGLASTKSALVYWCKYIGYRFILYFSLLRAKYILTVSHSVKNELIHFFPFVKSKLLVAYEGVDRVFTNNVEKSSPYEFPYFLVVGNVYPHKNAQLLVHALKELVSKQSFSGKIIFVTKNDEFTKRLKEKVADLGVSDNVLFLFDTTDEYLSTLYFHARAVLFPSLKEGFGLPALEAISLNTPVILSDIPVFRELFGKLPLRFIPSSDVDAWATAIAEYGNQRKSKEVYFRTEKERDTFFEQFRWVTLAKETRAIYERCTRV